MKKPATLVLIDGNALVHRSFHALPPLSQKGEPTNAVYGFTSVLLKVIRELKPDYVVATFDLAGPTFRHEEFAKYKAHRPKTPDELVSQFPKVKEVVRAFNIPIFEKAGFEADDLIGTIAQKVKHEKVKVKTIIITGDLDTLQLVDDTTEVCTLKKGISDTVIYDEKAVKERFGIAPSQMNDFKGLKGDPSDNIPGVPGIGEKTASSLLATYNSLEELYENIDIIPGNVGKKLKENKDQTFFSKSLATIKLDVPLDFNLKEAKFETYDAKKVGAVFQKFGFFTLLNRLSESGPPATHKQNPAEKAGVVAASGADIKALAKARVVAVSLEGEHVVIAAEGLPAHALSLKEAKPILEDATVQKISYDFKRMFKDLRLRGIALAGMHFDVLIAAYLLAPGGRNYSLEKIAFDELEESISEGGAASSPTLLLALVRKLDEKLKKEGLMKVFHDIEMPLVPVLADMELAGIKVDGKKLSLLSAMLADKIQAVSATIYKLAGEEFNLDSPKQMSKILFEKLAIKKDGKDKKTKAGLSSTKAGELEGLKDEHEIVRSILAYRELAKLKGTYADALVPLIDRKTGRIHTSYNQAGTATGRLSSLEPNLQNLPQKGEFARPLRESFIAEDGYELVSFDFSQIELRIIASLSKDKKMIAIFKEGGDIHTATAAEMNNVSHEQVTPEMRYAAKALNFGILYGMGQKGFADASGIDMKRAKEFIDRYFEEFAGIARFIEATKENARTRGFVQTLLGRRRWLADINSPNWIIRNAAERMAQNMPVQGLAADIMKIAMLRVRSELKQKGFDANGARMILQIHDELIFEVRHGILKEASRLIRETMESAYGLSVPVIVRVKAGPNLGALAAVEL